MFFCCWDYQPEADAPLAQKIPMLPTSCRFFPPCLWGYIAAEVRWSCCCHYAIFLRFAQSEVWFCFECMPRSFCSGKVCGERNHKSVVPGNFRGRQKIRTIRQFFFNFFSERFAKQGVCGNATTQENGFY